MAREVGIIIKATDQATPTIAKTGAAVQDLAKKTEDNFKKAEKSSEGFSLRLNAIIQIAQKAARASEMFFRATVGASLESRAEHDKLRSSWDQFAKSVDKAAIAIGDALLPAIVGLAKEFQPLVKGMTDWTNKNRELIASGFLEWTAAIGKTLTVLVGTVVIATTKAWTGLKSLYFAIVDGMFQLASVASGSLAKLLGKFETFAKLAGKDGMARAISHVRDEFVVMGGAADQVSEDFANDIGKMIADQQKLEDQIHDVSTAIFTAFDSAKLAPFSRKIGAISEEAKKLAEAMDAAMRRFNEKADAFVKNADKEREAQRKLATDLEVQYKEDAHAYQASMEAKKIAEFDANAQIILDTIATNKEREAVITDTLKSIASNAIGTFQSAFSGIGDIQTETMERMVRDAEGHWQKQSTIVSHHKKTVLDAFGEMAIGVGKMLLEMAAQYVIAKGIEAAANKIFATEEVTANAAKAASGAASSQSGIPIVGPILAVAAAGAIFAMVMSYLGKFAHGGMITGGRAGRDSVPIVGMPGERVLSLTETRIYERERVTGARARNMEPQKAGDIIVKVERNIPSNSAEEDR